MNLLDLPVEIRLQILFHLLANRKVKVEAELLEDLLDSNAVWVMKAPGGFHPRVLGTCRQLFLEGQPLLYTNNVFDCSQRETTNLLLAQIGAANFAQIKHMILEWDQLQDLSWSLAKHPGGSHFAGLESILLATWRTRILGGKSIVWLQSKNYERQLCIAAITILEKHPKLANLVQIAYRKGSAKSVHSNNNYRVKWKFVLADQALGDDETIVDPHDELEQLRVKPGERTGEPLPQMIDPF